MSGFTQRVLTAIVFVAVMVGGVYLHPISHILLFFLITVFCLWEYFDLTLPSEVANRKWIGMGLGMLPILLSTNLVFNQFPLNFGNTLLMVLVAIASIFLFELFNHSEKPYSNIGIVVLGLFYIGVPLALVPLITFNNEVFQPNIIFGLLLLTWANDTGAYLVGSQIGRTKLFPRISPKKTWEGSMGGVAVTFLVGYLLS